MARTHHRPESILGVVKEMADSNDRAAVIIGAALLEDTVLYALCRWLKLDYEGTAIERLCEDGAPLSTFSQKIIMAEAMGVFGLTVTRADLDLIRKLRNDFAHDMNPRSFDTHAVRQRMESVSIIKGSNPLRERPANHRAAFELAITSLVGLLIATAQTGEAR